MEDGGDRSRQILDAADRKSTRLNSSHSQISYAVFCLKKKKSALYNIPNQSRPSPHRVVDHSIHLPQPTQLLVPVFSRRRDRMLYAAFLFATQPTAPLA